MADNPIAKIQARDAINDLQASSWLRYNGILLADVLTKSHKVQMVQSPDNAQKLCWHHTIEVMCLLNPQYNSFTNESATTIGRKPGIVGTDSYLVIYKRLMEPCGFLQFAVGGKVIVSAPQETVPNEQTLACDNMLGPKPLYCQITTPAGTTSLYVSFGVEVWVDDCANKDGNVIQSHRYSMSHDVDGDTWLTTRVVQGQVKFRPDILQHRQQVPDQILIPNFFHPIPPGFARSNVKIQALPNGMELAYSFVDREKVLPLGSLSPATKLSAEFTIGSALEKGKPSITQAVCHVTAVGPKNQYRFNLLKMAMNIALRKLQKPGLQAIYEVGVTYSLDNKMVDLVLKAIWSPEQVGPQGLQISTFGLTAADDVNDIDAALLEFRSGDADDFRQGSQSHLARSPEMNVGGRKGTYLGYCIGSSLVKGCYAHLEPFDIQIPVDQYGNVQLNSDNENTGPVGLNPRNNLGNQVGFNVQLTNLLTITPLETGISAEAASTVGCYTEWSSTVSYRTCHQKAVMPVGELQNTSPGKRAFIPPQIASLGEPYTLKVVSWTVGWIGSNPNALILPSPDTGDPNDVLLEEDISPAAPAICNGTNRAWRVSGTYWYAQKQLHTSSLQSRGQYTGTDLGFALGKAITQPGSQGANRIGLSSFVAGYSPSYG